MVEVHYALPGEKLGTEYYDCRYEVLRKPLGFQRGAEILPDDSNAIHVWVADGELVIGVGRSHLLEEGNDGSGADIPGKDSGHAPPFGPLRDQSEQHRPAIQIRQMGTREEYRRMGIAAMVLSKLEELSVTHFGAKYGFLQAREVAYSFYESQNWSKIDEEYEIKRIGPHNSMIKKLN